MSGRGVGEEDYIKGIFNKNKPLSEALASAEVPGTSMFYRSINDYNISSPLTEVYFC